MVQNLNIPQGKEPEITISIPTQDRSHSRIIEQKKNLIVKNEDGKLVTKQAEYVLIYEIVGIGYHKDNTSYELIKWNQKVFQDRKVDLG